MGEPLYEEVVGPAKLDRPCRIYAPVGTHETLLAYLVRRLLENGANSSFVNRIVDESIPPEDVVAAIAAESPECEVAESTADAHAGAVESLPAGSALRWRCQCTRFTRERCSMHTPLGRPVEPEV